MKGINRYIMECKYPLFSNHKNNRLRINRYIMECKYRNNMGELLQRTRINRYIMECKLIISSAIRESSTELIDTLWNVN